MAKLLCFHAQNVWAVWKTKNLIEQQSQVLVCAVQGEFSVGASFPEATTSSPPVASSFYQ